MRQLATLGLIAFLAAGAFTAEKPAPQEATKPPADKPSGPQPGTILVYEIDSEDPLAKDPAIIKKTVEALDRRLNPGWWPQARIRQVDDRRIEIDTIDILRNDPQKAQRIERIVGRIGTLEFRILANDRDHRALIERARSEKGKEVKDGAGAIVARWVSVDPKEAAAFTADPHLTTRAAKDSEHEILVIHDPYNVTGAYLRQATPGTDQQGKPAVYFAFNSKGAELFGRLTGDNLPQGDFKRRLGMILDGRLFSAPSINSKIFDRGEITGSFSKEEVEDVVRVLNAGAFPVKIKLVEKRAGLAPSKSAPAKKPPGGSPPQ